MTKPKNWEHIFKVMENVELAERFLQDAWSLLDSALEKSNETDDYSDQSKKLLESAIESTRQALGYVAKWYRQE